MNMENKNYNNKIEQAVILAGGRGTRLRPFTDDKPKPMIEIAGKPFLEYLIEKLKEQGFTKILLLLGYKPDSIVEYFGDGSKWGIEIEYSINDVRNDTGRRIKLAENKIDDLFFLMYCDNYLPFNINNMMQVYNKLKPKALVTVYKNMDGYTKNNLRVGDDGFVEIYDKTRKAENLQGVDIGFIILNKEVINLLPDENVSFEKYIYQKLVEDRQLAAFITEHRYYSIGSNERLELTKLFFSDQKYIILDRDGVINKKAPKAKYIKSWDQWEWLPGAKDAIKLLTENNYSIILITNQAGIARGMMSEKDLDLIHNSMNKEINIIGGKITKIYYCPHGWNEGCECRKPNPGMLFNAQRDYNFDLTETFFIGDDIRDEEAGIKAGCKTILVNDNKSLLDIVKELFVKKDVFYNEYFDLINKNMSNINYNTLDTIVDLIKKTSEKGKKIIIAGNGGSASIASHVSIDLTKNAKIRAINFNEANLITCFSNDCGYEQWLEKAIDFYGDKDDLAILISCSGTSKNIINAVKSIKKKKINLVTFTGFAENNLLRSLGDINIYVNSRAYNIIESVHNIWLLAIVDRIIGNIEYKA